MRAGRRMRTSRIRFPVPSISDPNVRAAGEMGSTIRVDAAGRVTDGLDWVVELTGAWDDWLEVFEVEEWIRGLTEPVVAGPGYLDWFVATTRAVESLGPAWMSARTLVDTEIRKRHPLSSGHGAVLEALPPGPWETGAQFLEDLDQAIAATQ